MWEDCIKGEEYFRPLGIFAKLKTEEEMKDKPNKAEITTYKLIINCITGKPRQKIDNTKIIMRDNKLPPEEENIHDIKPILS